MPGCCLGVEAQSVSGAGSLAKLQASVCYVAGQAATATAFLLPGGPAVAAAAVLPCTTCTHLLGPSPIGALPLTEAVGRLCGGLV